MVDRRVLIEAIRKRRLKEELVERVVEVLRERKSRVRTGSKKEDGDILMKIRKEFMDKEFGIETKRERGYSSWKSEKDRGKIEDYKSVRVYEKGRNGGKIGTVAAMDRGGGGRGNNINRRDFNVCRRAGREESRMLGSGGKVE